MILATTGSIAALAVASAIELLRVVIANRSGLGVDFYQYQDHAARWLATGEFYLPRQLAGPTQAMDGDPLYPPTVLLLLVPFRILPVLGWWLIPIAIIVVTIAGLRPAPWTWPILAMIALWPRTPALIYYGNPGMWVVAFICIALFRPWAGPLVLVKPSLAPLALLGFGRRGWFIGLGLVVAASIPFGGLWLEYATVLRNSRVPLTYSLLDLPLALAPVIAFLGRRRNPDNSVD